MSRPYLWVLLFSMTGMGSAQSAPASDPQAVSLAAQSVAALTGGATVSDVTLIGNATWNGTDTGTVTLSALGIAESRIDLVLTSGTRTEIRDAQTGVQEGRWIAPDSTFGDFASQNCWTDAVWFFPALGSLAPQPSVVLLYVGVETRNGQLVQHIQSHLYQPLPYPGKGASPEQLSTIDFYLDAASLLPLTVMFNEHPDNDASTNLSVEIDYSNYQLFSGVNIPMHVQKNLQGSPILDVQLSGAALNTGLSLANFTVD